MKTQEDDPDTLQLLDESDKEWVKLWRKAKHKQTIANNSVYFIIQQKNLEPPRSNAKQNR